MNSTVEKHDEARPDVDELLHGYFQAQMPQSWPRFRAPVTLRAKQPASRWSRYCGRMAMAVCVALLVGGYIALSGNFPRQPPPSEVVPMHNIGMKEPKVGNSPRPVHSTDEQAPMGVRSAPR